MEQQPSPKRSRLDGVYTVRRRLSQVADPATQLPAATPLPYAFPPLPPASPSELLQSMTAPLPASTAPPPLPPPGPSGLLRSMAAPLPASTAPPPLLTHTRGVTTPDAVPQPITRSIAVPAPPPANALLAPPPFFPLPPATATTLSLPRGIPVHTTSPPPTIIGTSAAPATANPQHPVLTKPAVAVPVAPLPPLVLAPLVPTVITRMLTRLTNSNLEIAAAYNALPPPGGARNSSVAFPAELEVLLESSGLTAPVVPDIAAAVAPSGAVPRLFETRVMAPTDAGYADVVKSMGRGFVVQEVFSVHNIFREHMFRAKAAEIACSTPTGEANITKMWHTPKPGALAHILNTGINVACASVNNFFGRAACFARDPMKANDYSYARGTEELRVMLFCSVALGTAKQFETGKYDRTLIAAPPGFHSVHGNIRRAPEDVVYDNNQILVTHAVVYIFNDPKLELTTPIAVGTDQIVYVTWSLAEFFGKIQARTVVDSSEFREIRRLTGKLLTGKLTPEEYIAETSRVIKAEAPATLLNQLKEELRKCTLTPAGAAAATH